LWLTVLASIVTVIYTLLGIRSLFLSSEEYRSSEQKQKSSWFGVEASTLLLVLVAFGFKWVVETFA